MIEINSLTITLLTAIVTATAALFGVYVTNLSSEKRLELELQHKGKENSKKLIREKAEELYVLTDKWINNMIISYTNMSLVMQGQLNYNQYNDLIIENAKNNEGNFSRLEMIINIYFEDIKSSYEEMTNLREELNTISSNFEYEYIEGNINGKKYLETFAKLQYMLIDSGNKFKQVIAKKAINV